MHRADNGGVTALMHACSRGQDTCVLVMLKAGAGVKTTVKSDSDLTVLAYEGMTALMFACRNGHGSCAHQLIYAEADANTGGQRWHDCSDARLQQRPRCRSKSSCGRRVVELCGVVWSRVWSRGGVAEF